MKLHRSYYWLIVSITFYAIGMASCDDIIQKDISAVQLEIYSPPDSFTSSNYTIVFWWKEQEKAKGYRLQLVAPAFASVQQFIIDTLVINTRISLQLYPGTYQWRIRAENGNSYGPFVTHTLIVDSNSNLNGQSFTLTAPIDNFYTNNTIINFSWPSFPYATQYEHIITNSSTGMTAIKITSSNTLFDTLSEGNYKWKVRGLNTTNSSATMYSPERAIYIDLTSPTVSMPFYPANNSLDTNSVRLKWLRPPDVYGDSIFLALDSNFQNAILHGFTTDTSYLLSPLLISETYFWKLRSRDKAGNWSGYSSFYQFTVTQ